MVLRNKFAMIARSSLNQRRWLRLGTAAYIFWVLWLDQKHCGNVEDVAAPPKTDPKQIEHGAVQTKAGRLLHGVHCVGRYSCTVQ